MAQETLSGRHGLVTGAGSGIGLATPLEAAPASPPRSVARRTGIQCTPS
jgi:NAD(P)-dependent dehydrogenase (short-subunit alcohol dehydrogenase family)